MAEVFININKYIELLTQIYGDLNETRTIKLQLMEFI